MLIFVRLMNGEKLDFQMKPTDTILTFKHRIYDSVGIKVELQQLLYEGRELQNDEIIQECGLQEGHDDGGPEDGFGGVLPAGVCQP